MPKVRAKSIVWWVSFASCGLLLIVHFSLVQLSNMPMSPLKLQMADVLYSYVDPYFTQRWNFFAPTPIDHDIALLARGRYFDPTTGELQTSEWLDVSDALTDTVRKNRLTPLFHVEISLSNAVVEFNNNLSKDARTFSEKDGKRYLKPEIPADVDPVNMTVMKRTAMAALEITYPNVTFNEVQLGLMTYTFPRFTERHKERSDDAPTAAFVAWQPAEWVFPYCCYRGTSSAAASEGQGRKP